MAESGSSVGRWLTTGPSSGGGMQQMIAKIRVFTLRKSAVAAKRRWSCFSGDTRARPEGEGIPDPKLSINACVCRYLR